MEWKGELRAVARASMRYSPSVTGAGVGDGGSDVSAAAVRVDGAVAKQNEHDEEGQSTSEERCCATLRNDPGRVVHLIDRHTLDSMSTATVILDEISTIFILLDVPRLLRKRLPILPARECRIHPRFLKPMHDRTVCKRTHHGCGSWTPPPGNDQMHAVRLAVRSVQNSKIVNGVEKKRFTATETNGCLLLISDSCVP